LQTRQRLSKFLLIPIVLTPLFFSASLSAQQLTKQAIFTQPQLDEMNKRLDNERPYVVTDTPAGFYGDGNEIKDGAETFLNEEQNTGFKNRWTWMSKAIPIVDYTPEKFEPKPANSPCGSEKNCIDYMHYAAVLAAIWDGRADIETFSGESKSKDAHAEDLARAVWDVLVMQSEESSLDFSDSSRWVRNDADGNPHFMAIAHMSKDLSAYALVFSQLNGYASYTENVQSVEKWFGDAADFAYQRASMRANTVFGGVTLDTMTFSDEKQAERYADGPDIQGFVYTLNDGNNEPKLIVSNAQASGLNNRMLDFTSYVGNYGVHFNDATYKKFVWDIFRLVMEIGVFPDGSYNEHFRSSELRVKKGKPFNGPEQGLHYTNISVFKFVAEAYRHAVAVENGLIVDEERGKYFDFTTSDGTDERYKTVEYEGDSTSGGNKGLRLVLDNLSKWYRSSENGGFGDIRFARNGESIDAKKRAYTVLAAMANTYYNDADLKSYYLLDTTEGYSGPDYWSGGQIAVANAGPWAEHSVGLSWGESGSYGGYFGLASMENIVFSNSSPVAMPDNAEGNKNNLISIQVLKNDFHPDGDKLSVSIDTYPNNGRLVVNRLGTVGYIPKLNFSGQDSFVYRITDLAARSDTATVTITIDNRNNPPVAVADEVDVNNGQLTSIFVLKNDYDLDRDKLTVKIIRKPSVGRVVVNKYGTVGYIPKANFSGRTSFTYSITDGNTGSDTGAVQVNVTQKVTDNQ